MGRGGHSHFAWEDKLYSYGGWNSESQFNNLICFDINTCEWSDPDIYNDVSRWNHSAIMVEAIPSWKYFIFGGESTNFNEGQTRTFGEYVNSASSSILPLCAGLLLCLRAKSPHLPVSMLLSLTTTTHPA